MKETFGNTLVRVHIGFLLVGLKHMLI